MVVQATEMPQTALSDDEISNSPRPPPPPVSPTASMCEWVVFHALLTLDPWARHWAIMCWRQCHQFLGHRTQNWSPDFILLKPKTKWNSPGCWCNQAYLWMRTEKSYLGDYSSPSKCSTNNTDKVSFFFPLLIWTTLQQLFNYWHKTQHCDLNCQVLCLASRFWLNLSSSMFDFKILAWPLKL